MAGVHFFPRRVSWTKKQIVHGGNNYTTGKFTYTLAATKCDAASPVFLTVLIKPHAGKKIILVCDNGRFHKTAAVLEWLQVHRDQITVPWLPTYSPSLNLIERLWGHVKRTVLANVLYHSPDDLVAARCPLPHRRPPADGIHVQP